MENRAQFFQIGSIALLGNPATGHVVGLSSHEVAVARAFAAGEAGLGDVAAVSEPLAEQLCLGAYRAPRGIAGCTSCESGAELGAAARRADWPPISAPGPRPVRGAYLHVTHRCNLHCEGCYSWEGDRNRLADPTFDELVRALRYLSHAGVEELNLSGGEPFLRDDMPALLEVAAAECGISAINVLTNGTVLKPAVLAACAPLVSMVSVSFDGASADDAAWVRGTQRFQTLCAFVRAAQGAGMAVCITPTLHRRNVGDIPRYRALADELGTELGFSLLSVGSAGAVRVDLLPEEEELRLLADLMLEAAETDSAVAVESLACGLACRENCGAASTSLSVAADGTVYPCHMMHDERFSMGNVFSGPGPTAAERAAMAARVHRWDAASACHGCDCHWLCGGGCRARAIGSQTREDPYCTTHKAFYRGVIDQIEQHLTKEEDHAVSQ